MNFVGSRYKVLLFESPSTGDLVMRTLIAPVSNQMIGWQLLELAMFFADDDDFFRGMDKDTLGVVVICIRVNCLGVCNKLLWCSKFATPHLALVSFPFWHLLSTLTTFLNKRVRVHLLTKRGAPRPHRPTQLMTQEGPKSTEKVSLWLAVVVGDRPICHIETFNTPYPQDRIPFAFIQRDLEQFNTQFSTQTLENFPR